MIRPPGPSPPEVSGDGRFVVPSRDFVPASLRAYEEGRLREKVEEAIEALRGCTFCPRNCRVNRLESRFAVCKVARHSRASWPRGPHVRSDIAMISF